jgi:PIN domain nuclease of toxin-antitoxin system
LENSPQLTEKAKSIISDYSNEIYISIASVWEFAIKKSIGKLKLSIGDSKEFAQQIQENGLMLVGITTEQITRLETLPFIHRDPFDRMLIATAFVEGLTILTADENMRRYNVSTIW